MTPNEELIHRFLEDPAGLSETDLEQLTAHLRAEPAKAVELREQLIIDDLLGQKLAVDRKNFPTMVQQRLADFEKGEEEKYDQVADLRAIAAAAKTKVKLLDYNIQSVTQGNDALGEVSVKIEANGQTVLGRGSSTDIIEASARAYINAINKVCRISS